MGHFIKGYLFTRPISEHDFVFSWCISHNNKLLFVLQTCRLNVKLDLHVNKPLLCSSSRLCAEKVFSLQKCVEKIFYLLLNKMFPFVNFLELRYMSLRCPKHQKIYFKSFYYTTGKIAPSKQVLKMQRFCSLKATSLVHFSHSVNEALEFC